MNRREVGVVGEKLAADYLRKKGYKVVEANFRCREGEIDIICKKGGSLVFVEVRAKTGTGFGSPEESVTRRKKEKLIAAAMAYLATHEGLPEEWRIDFVAVECDPQGKVRRIEVIENAIEGE